MHVLFLILFKPSWRLYRAEYFKQGVDEDARVLTSPEGKKGQSFQAYFGSAAPATLILYIVCSVIYSDTCSTIKPATSSAMSPDTYWDNLFQYMF